jgi:hypothetical protein|tara:strand:- start:235 stop:510 length:276 start_codon:yes stop_codon:yes gene_type:complete
MAKYKNLSPQLKEGLIGKLFGALATKSAKKHIKGISKKDPKLGGLLARANKAADDAEKYLNSLDKKERAEFEDYRAKEIEKARARIRARNK